MSSLIAPPKLVAVISTGGTAASAKESGSGSSPEMSGDDLIVEVPGLS